MRTFAEAVDRREPRVVRQVRFICIMVAWAYGAIFWWSIYRRIRQVIRIEVRAPAVLAPGSSVGYDVITSGEVQNRIRLELVQDSMHVVLIEQRAAVNHISGLDPRVFHYTPTVTITPALFARFHPGMASLRLTGFGGQKLMRVPAPRVREVEVRLGKS